MTLRQRKVSLSATSLLLTTYCTYGQISNASDCNTKSIPQMVKLKGAHSHTANSWAKISSNFSQTDLRYPKGSILRFT